MQKIALCSRLDQPTGRYCGTRAGLTLRQHLAEAQTGCSGVNLELITARIVGAAIVSIAHTIPIAITVGPVRDAVAIAVTLSGATAFGSIYRFVRIWRSISYTSGQDAERSGQHYDKCFHYFSWLTAWISGVRST
jgi:hypothetical protein